MLITLIPVRSDATLSLQRTGDVLTVNGQSYDLAPLPEGAVLPRAAVDCAWLASDIIRHEGRLQLSLILPHGPEPGPAMAFPQPLDVTTDGPVTLPTETAE